MLSAAQKLAPLPLLIAMGCLDAKSAPSLPEGSSYTSEHGPVLGVTTSSGAGDAGTLDGGAPDAWTGDPAIMGDVSLEKSASFDGYLVDAQGRALYMFTDDVAGASTSVCKDACKAKWPPFDITVLEVGPGLSVSDFTRFHRDDGTWQTAYKGHPLYRFSMDEGKSVRGDGVAGRWFLARNYDVFMAARTQITPQGATNEQPNTPFLTNGAGRAVYVSDKDEPASDTQPEPKPACVAKCLETWPVWKSPVNLKGLVVPSTIDASNFGWFTRTTASGAVDQLTYRGYPLYFFASDDTPGEATGHNVSAWRVIDPGTFAVGAAPGADK